MNWRGPAFVFAVLFVAFGVLLSCFEPVYEEADLGPQGEARVNPYLAFERTLTRLGAPASTHWGKVDLPQGDHTIVLLGPEPLPADVGLDDLLAWVAAGGQLVAAPAATRGADVLLARFGLAVGEAVDEAADGAAEEAAQGAAEAAAESEPAGGQAEGDGETGRGGGDGGGPPADVGELLAALGDDLEVVRVELPWAERRFEVRLPRGRVFVAAEPRDELAEVFFAAERVHLVDYGEGTIWFVIDDRFLENDLLGRLDHARLGWALVEWLDDEGDHRGGVTLVVRSSPPSLLALLWRHGWAPLVSGAVLLAALLVAVAGRLGPLRKPPPEERRRLLEHVEASAAFLWQHGRGADLVASARGALLARLERRQPAWAKLPPRELVERLAAHSGVAAPRIGAALYGPPAAGRPDPNEFTHSIAVLETVRRTL